MSVYLHLIYTFRHLNYFILGMFVFSTTAFSKGIHSILIYAERFFVYPEEVFWATCKLQWQWHSKVQKFLFVILVVLITSKTYVLSWALKMLHFLQCFKFFLFLFVFLFSSFLYRDMHKYIDTYIIYLTLLKTHVYIYIHSYLFVSTHIFIIILSITYVGTQTKV